MKMRIASFVLAALTSLMILATNETSAQVIGSKYGKDSVKCVTNLSLYREFYKQKNYKAAIISWRQVFNNCPRATENIYINGANMFKSFIAAQKDAEIKKGLIDTLMLIYDARITYYGKEGLHLANKANDLLNADSTRFFEAYTILKHSIELLKNASEETALLNYCQSGIASFKAGKITNDALVGLYNETGSIIDGHLSIATGKIDSLKWTRIRTMIETKTFPLLECKDIAAIFTRKLAATPDDLALLKNISAVLLRKECTADSLYLFALAKMNSIEPSANTAFLIAREYVKRKNMPLAIASLNGVIDKLKDNESKARTFYYLGVVYAESKDYSNARTNALKAVALKSDYGEPYLLIAECYALSAASCGNDDVSIRAPFWCAVDKLNKAKLVDPKLAETANKLIIQYSANFPNTEMLFFKDIKNGSKYLVDCWINESTIVRSSK
jgi:tetratricopeptide (TPR) repeat protein